MPLQHIFLAVPALNRKAEARATDLNVRPATDSLSGEESEDSRAIGNELPTAVSLFADEAVARAGISVARGAAFGEDNLGEAVTIEVAHFLDRPGCVGGRWIVAGAPLLALEFVASSLERSSLVSGWKLRGRAEHACAEQNQRSACKKNGQVHRIPSSVY